MEIFKLLPQEQRGLLSLDTGPKIVEHEFDVKYLGNLPMGDVVMSSEVLDKVIASALERQAKEQEEMRISRANSLPSRFTRTVSGARRGVMVRSASASDPPILTEQPATAAKEMGGSLPIQEGAVENVTGSQKEACDERPQDGQQTAGKASSNESSTVTSPEHNSGRESPCTGPPASSDKSGQEGSESGDSVLLSPVSNEGPVSQPVKEEPAGGSSSEAKETAGLKYKDMRLVLSATAVRLYGNENNASLLWEKKLPTISHCFKVR